MSIRSRFQALPPQLASENPNLKPRAPIVDPWASRGRFQNVNLGANPVEEQTRVDLNNEGRLQPAHLSQSGKASAPKVVKQEETVTTVVEDQE